MNIRIVRQMLIIIAGSVFAVSGCNSDDLVTIDPEKDSAVVDISLTAIDNPPPGEAEQIAAIANKTTQLQEMRPGDQILRGVHAKAHGCVSAEFRVNDNLEGQYQVGLFKTPGKSFQAEIRFSNAAVLREHDLKGAKNGSRGMAIKVLDVDGLMLSKDRGRKNQDFLMINTSQFAFPTVRAYGFLTDTLLNSKAGADPTMLLALGALIGAPTSDPITPDHFAAMQVAATDRGITVPEDFSVEDLAAVNETLKVIGTIQGKVVRNPAQTRYFGAAPFLFGTNRVMKFSAEPCNPVFPAPFVGTTPDKTPENPTQNYLREALNQSMLGDREICYNFQIQVRESKELSTENIENASTEWPEEMDKYVNVARITIAPRQNIDSADAQESCEKLVFTPWHSLADHQPVGGINRLRQGVYRNSATHRQVSIE
jgi:hypothetical protein